MTPKHEAIAFRIWQHCEEHGWDFYPSQLADVLGETTRTVAYVIRHKKWQDRLPSLSAKGNLVSDSAVHRVPEVEPGVQELNL